MSALTDCHISETTQQKLIFRDSLNDQGTLFGGTALKWMDEVSYITASKFSHQRMVTVSVEKVRFILPVPMGSWVEVTGRVVSVGKVKLTIGVEIWMHELRTEKCLKAVDGFFVFAAVNDQGTPVALVAAVTSP